MSIKSTIAASEIQFHDKLAFPLINKKSVLTKYLIAIRDNPMCDRPKLQELVYGMYKGPGYGVNMINNLIYYEYINVFTVSKKHVYTITNLGNFHLTKILS